MIVLAIVDILAATGYPAYVDYAKRARRADGKAFLMDVQSAAGTILLRQQQLHHGSRRRSWLRHHHTNVARRQLRAEESDR